MRALVLASFVVLLAACGGQPAQPAAAPAAAGSTPATGAPPAATGSAAATSAVVKPGDAKIGDKTLCLISKEEFVVTASSPKAEHEGKTYYFCCPGCDAKFKADPKKYLAN